MYVRGRTFTLLSRWYLNQYIYIYFKDEFDDSPGTFSENQYDEIPAEDMNSETSALVQNDDIDAHKNKGCKCNEI